MAKRRKKKNAGHGYGMDFHGAFGSKADAVRKERQVHGFIRPATIKGEKRYIVMSPRKNPRRPRRNKEVYTHRAGSGRGEERTAAQRRAIEESRSKGRGPSPRDIEDIYEQTGYKGFISNPSELVVLGANPSRRRSAWGYGHDMAHNPRHKTIVLKPHTTYTIRTNPSAEAIRESFTGMPAEKYETFDVEGMPSGEYAELGKLLSLYVKPVIGGQVREIRFKQPYPLLVSDTSRRQLYFVEGDQDVSQGINLFNDSPTPGVCELGEVRRVDYKQRKEHLPNPGLDEWKHHFGEENGVRPTLWFNERTKQLLLKGGDYTVRSEGITN
jgi:hypothetical protein